MEIVLLGLCYFNKMTVVEIFCGGLACGRVFVFFSWDRLLVVLVCFLVYFFIIVSGYFFYFCVINGRYLIRFMSYS